MKKRGQGVKGSRGQGEIQLSFTLFILVSTLILFYLSAPFAFSRTVSHKEVEAIARALRCPVCQNLSVADSDSVVSNQMRAKIRKMLEDGKTEKQVTDYFVSKYGEWILLSPPKHGFNWLVWAGPFGAVLLGGFFLVRFLRKNSASLQESISPESATYLQKVQKELETLDEGKSKENG